ncbi:MAG: oligopeptide transporter, OPT family, partial [Thermoplasmata archaeon]
MVAEEEPFVPAHVSMPEFTVKSILVGVLITIIMGSANAYLGLLVGMTVSATIPALVIGLAFMRPLKGTILETNMTKNIGVAGEALAAGIVFTFPALLIIYVVTDHQAGWATLGDHLPLVMLLSFVGGLLGVFFTIPLRRVFIEVEKLPYPEGVASGKVLITMYGGEQMLHYITFSMLIAGGMKFLSTSGLNLWREKLEYVLGRGKARLFGGLNISPALLGVGYIIGPRISGMVFAGGVLGWLVLIPLIGALVGWPTVDFQGNPITNPVDAVYAVWFQYTKWVGVGAVLTGGIWTLWTLRKTLMDSLRSSIKIGKEEGVGSTEELPRTERDMQVHVAYYVIIFVAMFIINYYVLKLFIATLVSTFVLFAAAFLFTAVAGYLAGIVGSSNNPISSVTISTLVITAAMLYLLQVNPSVGMPATILVAAIVCVSAAIAGDSMQELKTANMVGATPYDIQKGRIIGVLTASITIPAVVWMLESAYG